MIQTGADDRIIETGGNFTPARVLGVLLMSCALAAVFGSAQLVGWTESLPDRPASRILHDAALGWHSAMSEIGATRPHDWLRGLIRGFEAMRFESKAEHTTRSIHVGKVTARFTSDCGNASRRPSAVASCGDAMY
jgi:hypothetical protein